MSVPVFHHQAAGIHPAAFVQDSEPDTSAVQDGVLWLDTSAGPPYVLRRWDATDALWRAIQMDATGYPLPDGSRLDQFVDGSTGRTVNRFMNADGYVCWYHDGLTFVVNAGPAGHEALQLPLPLLSGAPPFLVGQDPDSELLALCPHPANTGLPPTPPGPVVVPSGQAVQARCGASSALTGHLTSVYSRWASELGVVTSLVGTVALTAFLINLVDPIYDVALVGASAAGLYQVMRSLITSLVSAASGTLFDSLTTDETAIIQKACFCALSSSAGTVPITQAAINGWRAGLPGDLGLPGTLTNQLLDAILAYTPLIDWQIAAQGAGTSSACDTWICP